MPRAEDDTWDIATGVGLTAVTVAASRATETAAPRPLITDPYAAILIAGAELRPLMEEFSTAGTSAADARALVNYHAARTRFFDDYMQGAAAAGVRQHVILASGLDARAFRLEWPPNSRVFEIDQPLVLDYKADTLRRHDLLDPGVRWTRVGIDLRSHWGAALEFSGFDPNTPTTWLAEGLLPFLSAGDQDELFRTIDELSAPRSRVALEAFNVAGGSLLETIESRIGRSEANGDNTLPLNDLWYGDEGRSDPAQWWHDRGWQVDTTHAASYLATIGRPIGPEGSFAELSTFITGVKS